MRAAQGSDPQVISLLLEAGAGGKKIFAENKKGKTVMDVAGQWCDSKSFTILKEHFDKVPPPKVSQKTNSKQTGIIFLLFIIGKTWRGKEKEAEGEKASRNSCKQG